MTNDELERQWRAGNRQALVDMFLKYKHRPVNEWPEWLYDGVMDAIEAFADEPEPS